MRSLVAVYEERSFTRAAAREGSTQSGISQHIAQLETELGIRLFTRGAKQTEPTAQCRRFYRDCVDILHRLETAERGARDSAETLSGKLDVGVIPALSMGALAPALKRFTVEHPNIEIHVLESYSDTLTDMVRAGELDFAIVPGSEGALGLRVTPLVRDREVLIAKRDGPHRHLQPVRLAELAPMKIVMPSPPNFRRKHLSAYCETAGAKIESIMELSAMTGNLDFIAQSDWLSVVPTVLLAQEFDRTRLAVRPLVDPPLHVDLAVVETTRAPLTPQATIFRDLLRGEIQRILDAWAGLLDRGVG